MPDPPPPRRQYSPAGNGHKTVAVSQRQLRYAELHCRTNFSFLEGASHPDELVERAAELGYGALAITDRNSLAGVVRAHVAAKDLGVKLIVGVEITPVDAPPVVLLATDRASYGRLSRLITRGRRNAPKGECRLTFDDVAEHADGLLGLSAEVGGRNTERIDGANSSVAWLQNAPHSALRPPRLPSGWVCGCCGGWRCRLRNGLWSAGRIVRSCRLTTSSSGPV